MARMKLEQLVEQLRLAYGADLRAVVLYGSAAAGEHIPDRSDYNVLVISDSITAAHLRAAGAIAAAWAEGGNPPPLTLTTAEWSGSADIFPMEYADILERHRVLHGTLPVEGITVSRHDLRLELEQQAMGKVLRLRQGVMAAHGDKRLQTELLEASLSTLMVIFRAVSRLHGEVPPGDYEALSAEIARKAQFEAEPFVRVVQHVRGTRKIAGAEAGAILEAYLAAMKRLVSYLDRFAEV
ncbi:MAG TPA: nucleotidyltransferase domain-containing protein [Gemmatimonadaceae bacterium]|nr:nucleotidyltransferase domain-containing protein [Gemmatimonadaceae bacterium]